MRLPAPALAMLLLAAIVVLVALGVWQLQRNEWRNELVAERHARHAAGPMELSALRGMELDEVDFHRARVRGTWDFERAQIIANRARFHTKGEEVVVPLLLAPDGPALLVNRGWYPEELRDEVLGALAAETTGNIEGVVRYDASLRAQQTAQGTWTGVAPASMGVALPYEVLPWFLIEGEMLDPRAAALGVGRPAELPAHGYLPYESHVPHLEYAMTWFGIAAVLAGVAVIRLVVIPRRERQRARATAEGCVGADV